MFIKIYFNDKPLFLCNDINIVIQSLIHHDDTVFIDELNSHTIKTMIHEMQQPQVHAGVFYHNDLEALKKAFWKKFDLVIAAGGVVFNEKNEILLIFRRGLWDLPKGKLDKGEKLEACAIREVKEETGLSKTNVKTLLCTTYHTYHEGARFKLKESFWYKMQAAGKQQLIPQTEEDIEALIWVKPADMKKYLNQCYSSVRDVLELILN